MTVQQLNLRLPVNERLSPAATALSEVIASAIAAVSRSLSVRREARVDAARARRRAQSEAEVTAMARRYMASQPSFAKDLLAACQHDQRL